MVGGGLELGAILAFVLFCLVVGFQTWAMWAPIADFFGFSQRSAGAPPVHVGATSQPGQVIGSLFATPTPTAMPEPVRVEVDLPEQILLVTPTAQGVPLPDGQDVNQPGSVEGYDKVLIVGRFSNYWPASGGINAQGDAEHFADGSRVDQALAEGWRVVACPTELLLGSRIEWPPDSGLVWTCRDRGEAITFYYSDNGLPIYWFDFLAPDAFVDYGSYIQVQLYVPQ